MSYRMAVRAGCSRSRARIRSRGSVWRDRRACAPSISLTMPGGRSVKLFAIGTAAACSAASTWGNRDRARRSCGSDIASTLPRAASDAARCDRFDRGLRGCETHGAYGNVDVAKGLLVGLPAVAGVLVGTSLQQRISGRTISLVFSALLAAVAIELLV